ncbi:helix-turn-helix transcriptional regulator [Lichenicola cladoniae]|uniref:Helix-turn-helix transcriptional regulator n=1 Tax=Lichenicola cladoniae TaxID=1484109 RepID=A0A6M8HN93_9PROT|nr:helix-turn-helix transcriptional regulator [Lichenicola cladoniae]NPD67265.1 helix-turn-helix transcriptional regulator [Acetobacteraceae bacterium]QKE89770.1 helix-turn-helix transcriptional regulator [Lichenicola cladoniae]
MSETEDQAFVRLLIERTGLNQTALAKAAGLGPDILSKIKRSKTGMLERPNLDKLQAFAASVGMDDLKERSQLVGSGKSSQSPHPNREVALVDMWRDLEEPEQALTFDIVEAAVRSSLRRRYGRP